MAQSRYVLIESRDPFESNDAAYAYELAASLARTGQPVTVFLVQNGVLPARPGARTPALEALARAGVEVLADEFSLRERGIGRDRLAPCVAPAPIDVVVERLAAGAKVFWH
ncbi:MAG TPA: DsrE family protein [Candidatus Tectomicrobia bacterium]|nr:DsrE family protein [Candidatus Tectomicrobia bacterium]